jgi:4-amino-4-deoxy-L-arabinose transferase-like glycosyltransferase
VAELGRAIAVLVGAAAVFVTFLLAREMLPAPAALAAAAVTAVTPLVAMHARYLKEDIFVLLFILLSLLALIRTLKSPTHLQVLLLGAAIGLAAAAKYVGIILVPFAAAALWTGLPELDRGTRLKLAGQAALAPLGVFVLLHLPALWEFHQLPEGTRLLVTSSLIYDRYGALAASQLQSQEIRRRAARYAELFARPYLDSSNGRPSFAFFNPVFRIVALDGDAAHLQRLATKLRAKHPNLSMTLVNVRLP